MANLIGYQSPGHTSMYHKRVQHNPQEVYLAAPDNNESTRQGLLALVLVFFVGKAPCT